MIPVPEIPAISAASVLHGLWAILWLLIVFAAILGYGGLAFRMFGARRTGAPEAAAAGFAVVILLGGVLNLLLAIRPGGLLGVVLVGVAMATLWVRCEAPWAWPGAGGARWLLAGALAVCAVRVLGNVHIVNFEPSDDLNFYVAAPKKMLETHWFAPDPFSERRVMTSVGGNEFLQTLILAEQPLSSVGLAENGLGAILLLVMGLALGREFELTARQRYGFALLLMVTPQLRLNLTFVVLPSALFLGLVYLAAHRRLTEERPWMQGLVLGGVAGAIATMKSTYIAHAVVFVGCVFLLRWWKRGFLTGARLLGMAALGCLVTMLPWMVASHAASGTWFFPLLGKGVHYSAYGMYPAPSSLTLHMLLYKVLPFNVPILVVFFAELLWGEKDERSSTAMALTLAAFVGSTMVGLATGGDSVRRYNFPCILPALRFRRRAALAMGGGGRCGRAAGAGGERGDERLYAGV